MTTQPKKLKAILDVVWQKGLIGDLYVKDEDIDQALAEIKKLLPSEDSLKAILCEKFAKANEQGIVVSSDFDYKDLAQAIYKEMEGRVE